MFRKAGFGLMVLLCVTGLIAPVGAQDKTCQQAQIRSSIQRVIDEGFNQGIVAVIDEAFADSYVNHPDGNRDTFKATITALRQAMPAGMASVDHLLVEGCNAFFVFRLIGTLDNALQFPGQEPLPATGKPLELTSHVYLHFDEQGQAVEEWDYRDNFSTLVQTGVIPMPTAEADAPSDTMMTEDTMVDDAITTSGNEARFADYIRQSYEQGNTPYDVDLLRQRYAPEYAGHGVDGSVASLEEFIVNLGAVRAALPDVTYTVNDTVAQGDYVAARITLSGTFKNALVLRGQDAIPPTGQPITLEISFWHRLNGDGQIVEDWEIYDQLSLFAQLGVM